MKWLRKTWLRVIGIVILIVATIIAALYFRFQPAENVSWGVSFSSSYAQYLGLDPVETFNRISTELHPQHIRLAVYWETIEPQPGQFDFTQTDVLLTLAQQHQTDVLLIIGHKQPRWPECHHPNWYEQLTAEQRHQAVLNLLTAEVMHFQQFSVISRWQVENEALFNYGRDCPPITPAVLAEEVKLVKSLDPRPIVLTDSGEKGDWFRTAKPADIFGSTMYRTVYNPSYGGYVSYHLPPAFYRIRASLLQLAQPGLPVIGVELQAEPWFAQDIHDTPLNDQLKLMNAQKLKDNIAYARDTGFSEHYLWGVEWWYWLNDNHGDVSLLEVAQQLFNHDNTN